jgi:ribosomal protein S8E
MAGVLICCCPAIFWSTGRPGANTKLGTKRVHVVRGRGGNLKFRALRLETGNFAWRSESEWSRLFIYFHVIQHISPGTPVS